MKSNRKSTTKKAAEVMESIYVVSTKEQAARNMYKVGRHKGTNRDLDSRYTTSLINPITYHLSPVDKGTSATIEAIIKKRLLAHRERNLNGSLLEWVNWERKKIIDVITDVIETYQKTSNGQRTACDDIDEEKIYPYTYMDINDLTLQQQFFIIAGSQYPYRSILDNLNYHPDMSPYHNMEYASKDIIVVHDGDDWTSDIVDQVIEDIIAGFKPALDTIFGVFKIFLTEKCKKDYISKLEYTNTRRKSFEHFLCNGIRKYPRTYEQNDPIFDNLAFPWNDVKWYIARLMEIGINFNQSEWYIFWDIKSYLDGHSSQPTTDEKRLFRKLIVHSEAVVCGMYEKSVSSIRVFIESCLEKTDDYYFIPMGKLYECFRQYYRESDNNDVRPNKKQLRNYIQICTDRYIEKTDSIRGYKIPAKYYDS